MLTLLDARLDSSGAFVQRLSSSTLIDAPEASGRGKGHLLGEHEGAGYWTQ